MTEAMRWQQFLTQAQTCRDLCDYPALLNLVLDILPRLDAPRLQYQAWLNLLPLIEQGQVLPLEQVLFQLLENDADQPCIWLLLGLCAQRRGDPRRARVYLQACLARDPQFFLAHQSYLWSFLLDPSLTFEQQMAPFGEYGRLLEHLSPTGPERLGPEDAERPLRVGYVSGDFYDHSVTHMFSALLAHGHAPLFERYAYATIPRQGARHDWFRSRFQHWRDISGVSATEAAALIRADGIDILLDLNGQTYGHRFDLFARKPAPIQITGLGFAWSSGLSRMDYLLTDAQIVPPERRAHYTEAPLYLSSYFHWQPEPDILDLEPLRQPEPAYPCLGALHQGFKLNLETLQLWSEILKLVPEARLLLKDKGFDNPQIQGYYRLLFKSWGVAPQRLLFAGRTSQREHVLLYQHIDVFLDPFPYQAGISCCEALWMGVPVVALSGGTRSANSLLHSVGHPELLTQNRAAYVSLAVDLLQDAERRQAYRQSLRKDLLASPICDAQRFCAETEAFYRAIWRQYVAARC